MLRRLLGSLALLTAILVCSLGLVLIGYSELQKPIELPAGQGSLVWQVDKGSSLTHVNRQLHQREILSHAKLLSLYARVSGRGEYRQVTIGLSRAKQRCSYWKNLIAAQ